MKQVQLRNGGQILVADVDPPQAAPGRVLLQTRFSLVSPGTETGLIHGNLSLDQPFPLGYNAMGVDPNGVRYAAYGGPYTHHAGMLSVPQVLVARVPENVSDQAAAFGGLGTIAIHSVRQARLQFGETAVVVGLGVLGNLVAQVALSAGYQVLATDVVAGRREVAERLGIAVTEPDHESVKAAVLGMTDGQGADAVLICAGGAGAPFLDQAIDLVRLRGKVVIVGNVKPEFKREGMFQKEAEVLIARAGGPGRYDPLYEEQGLGYLPGYVRWTEGRNLVEFIRLLACGRVQAEPLITDLFPVTEAPLAYQKIKERPSETMGVLLRYE